MSESFKGGSGPPVLSAWVDVFHTPGEAVDSIEQLNAPHALLAELRGAATSDAPTVGIVRTSYPVQVRLRPVPLKERQPGRQMRSVEVKTTRGVMLSLPVTWIWRESVEVQPSHVHFGTITDLESKPATVTIRSTEGRPFRLLSVRGDDTATVSVVSPSEVGADSTAKESHTLAFTVRLTSGTDARVISGTTTVETDDPDCPAIPIPWSAFVGRPSGIANPVSVR
jgi:hypothetical protein